MLSPVLLAADFLRAFRQLMPRGPVWPADVDATQTAFLSGLAPSYERQSARDVNLLADAFPAAPYELLPEWEATLGLPDPCAGVAPSIAARQAQVKARFVGQGGQSAEYFTAYAAALGYTITVTMDAPARIGVSAIGDPINDAAWAHVWYVNAPLVSIIYAEIGVSAIGDPLASWGNTVLECELNAIAPAHTVLHFRYS